MKAWVAEGAAIYVCGSLKGMAPAVHQALTDILGADALEAIAQDAVIPAGRVLIRMHRKNAMAAPAPPSGRSVEHGSLEQADHQRMRPAHCRHCG